MSKQHFASLSYTLNAFVYYPEPLKKITIKVFRDANKLRVLFALFALVDKSAKIKRLCGVSLIFSNYNLHILLLYFFSAQISKPAL